MLACLCSYHAWKFRSLSEREQAPHGAKFVFAVWVYLHVWYIRHCHSIIVLHWIGQPTWNSVIPKIIGFNVALPHPFQSGWLCSLFLCCVLQYSVALGSCSDDSHEWTNECNTNFINWMTACTCTCSGLPHNIMHSSSNTWVTPAKLM